MHENGRRTGHGEWHPRPVKRKAGRASKRDGRIMPQPETSRRPEPERRYVDIDPWAVLLEQLMEVPEEQPAERDGAKGK
jgi:hypothetical protein